MIIKKEKEEINEKTKKVNILKKLDKKKIIILIIGLIIILLISIFLINYNKIDKTITIDIVSTDISYSYGPNTITNSNLKVGQEIKLKIISDNNKFIKCYSTNEDVLEFKEKNNAIAKDKGYTQIYCKNSSSKSNIIDVIVGD